MSHMWLMYYQGFVEKDTIGNRSLIDESHIFKVLNYHVSNCEKGDIQRNISQVENNASMF